MITLGLCNIFGSFVQSMPTCGAFTRSAVSAASGVKTPMVGLYSGTMTLLALSLLTPYFYFIPKATLASVLICAVVYMVSYLSMKNPSNVLLIIFFHRLILILQYNCGIRIGEILLHGSYVFLLV